MPTFAIAPASLHRLRRRLQATNPQTSALLLQEAGFATGEGLFVQWREHLKLRARLDDPAWLDREWFGPLLSELCANLGWGSFTLDVMGSRALLMTSTDWAESERGSSPHPSCHFSCGCFAAFLTAQAGAQLAVLEVECRSRGDAACCFLAGSSENLAAVYDVLNAGAAWRDALPSD